MSKVIVEDIGAEDLFKWFYEIVFNDGGDGSGLICCNNIEETSNWFVNWWKETYNQKFPYMKDIYIHNGINFINYHDNSNENLSFADKEAESEYSFVVKKDCIFRFDPSDAARIIKAV